MKRLIPFLFGVLLAGLMLAPYARAETIPATATTTTPTDPGPAFEGTNKYWSADYKSGTGTKAWCVSNTSNYNQIDEGVSKTVLYNKPMGQASTSGGVCVENITCPTSSTKVDTDMSTSPSPWTPGGTDDNYHAQCKCNSGTTYSNGSCVGSVTTYSCPAGQNWQLTGQSCWRPDCDAGITRDANGVCQNPSDYCQNKKNVTVSSGFYDMGTSPDASFPAVQCDGSCAAQFDGTAPAATSVIAGVTHYYAKGSITYNGDTCNNPPNIKSAASSAAPPPNTCSSSQYPVYVNGKFVCIDKTTNQPQPTMAPQTTTENKTTKTNADGSTEVTTTKTNPDGSTTTTTVKTNIDGSQSTTTTSNIDPSKNAATEGTQKQILEEIKKVSSNTANGSTSGGSSGGTVTSGTVQQGFKDGMTDYCAQNPNSPMCKPSGTASGGGDCVTAPTCSGDAIQCAVLQQSWQDRCQVEKTNQALGQGSDLAVTLATHGTEAMTGDPLDRSGLTETINVSNQISTSKFLSGGGLADKTVALPYGKSLVIPFSQLNFYLQIFGNVMIACAMIAAARIVGVV